MKTVARVNDSIIYKTKHWYKIMHIHDAVSYISYILENDCRCIMRINCGEKIYQIASDLRELSNGFFTERHITLSDSIAADVFEKNGVAMQPLVIWYLYNSPFAQSNFNQNMYIIESHNVQLIVEKQGRDYAIINAYSVGSDRNALKIIYNNLPESIQFLGYRFDLDIFKKKINSNFQIIKYLFNFCNAYPVVHGKNIISKRGNARKTWRDVSETIYNHICYVDAPSNLILDSSVLKKLRDSLLLDNEICGFLECIKTNGKWTALLGKETEIIHGNKEGRPQCVIGNSSGNNFLVSYHTHPVRAYIQDNAVWIYQPMSLNDFITIFDLCCNMPSHTHIIASIEGTYQVSLGNRMKQIIVLLSTLKLDNPFDNESALSRLYKTVNIDTRVHVNVTHPSYQKFSRKIRDRASDRFSRSYMACMGADGKFMNPYEISSHYSGTLTYKLFMEQLHEGAKNKFEKELARHEFYIQDDFPILKIKFSEWI